MLWMWFHKMSWKSVKDKNSKLWKMKRGSFKKNKDKDKKKYNNSNY